MTEAFEARLKRIRLIAFDFDGVFTDNTVYVFEDGREAVRCSRGDGMGIALLKRTGVDAVVISLERNPVVAARTRKLALRCIQGCDDKVTALKGIVDESGISLEEVAFVGNDVNDIPCLSIVGLPIVVADSHPDVLPLGAYRTERPGGRGAVREICDMFVRARSGD